LGPIEKEDLHRKKSKTLQEQGTREGGRKEIKGKADLGGRGRWEAFPVELINHLSSARFGISSEIDQKGLVDPRTPKGAEEGRAKRKNEELEGDSHSTR